MAKIQSHDDKGDLVSKATHNVDAMDEDTD
jgi:hypothetical protein